MSRTTKCMTGSRPPKRPSIHETRLAMAEAGQYEDLLTILRKTCWTMLDIEELWGLVLRAMEVRSRQDPERFARDMFAEMVAFSSYLLLRAQFILGFSFAQHGEMLRTSGHADLPRDISEKQLPRLVELQGHLAELLQGQAATARAWQLVRRGRIGNDKAERPTRQRTAEVAVLAGAVPVDNVDDTQRSDEVVVPNGHAMSAHRTRKSPNRINGLLNGLGSGNGVAPHDD